MKISEHEFPRLYVIKINPKLYKKTFLKFSNFETEKEPQKSRKIIQ